MNYGTARSARRTPLISNNQEYRELQHRQSQNKAELLEALSDEQKELLEKFCATEIELNGISEREAFTAGFKIAMRLAAEAFYEGPTSKRMTAKIVVVDACTTFSKSDHIEIKDKSFCERKLGSL